MTVKQMKEILNDIDDEVVIYDGNMDEIEFHEFHEFIEYPKMDDSDYLMLWA